MRLKRFSNNVSIIRALLYVANYHYCVDKILFKQQRSNNLDLHLLTIIKVFALVRWMKINRGYIVGEFVNE
jgi:hypothetical protein